MSDLTERRRVGSMERHIKTILIAVITGAIFFVGNFIFAQNSKSAAQVTTLEFISTQIVEIRGDLRALQASSVSRKEYEGLETRVQGLEQRVTELRERLGVKQ